MTSPIIEIKKYLGVATEKKVMFKPCTIKVECQDPITLLAILSVLEKDGISGMSNKEKEKFGEYVAKEYPELNHINNGGNSYVVRGAWVDKVLSNDFVFELREACRRMYYV